MGGKYTFNEKTKRYEVDRNDINSGHGTQPDYDRNEELINDYLNGMRSVDMVIKHHVSWQRINQVLDSYSVPKRKSNHRKINKKKGVK